MITLDANAMSYGEMCAAGRARADDLIHAMREGGNPLLLASAVREIGELTPDQIGFLSRIASVLISQ